MSFNIPIEVNPGASVSKIDHVAAALAAAEKRSEMLSAACTRLGQNFEGLGAVMQRRARATEIHAQANNTLANSFAGIATQIAREKQMLDQIHGPMQRFQQDVKTLNALMSQGRISSAEYANELKRVYDVADRAGVNTGRMPGKQTPAASVAAPGRSGGTMSTLAAAAAPFAGIAVAQQVLALSDSYTGLENRLKQVATSQGNLNDLMKRTKEIANATRSDWATTGESFVRLIQATKQLGLSQERGLKITETLNMALQSSGASASEAAAGTLQLMQAMSAGALQGDEFRSIAENMPVLMDILAKQLGVTRGELKKMGADGKITTDIMIKGLEAASASIHDNFAKSVPTAAQQWTIFKNEMMQTVGEFMRSTNIIPKLGEALKTLADGLKIVVSFFSAISSVGSAVSGVFDKLGNAARIAMGPIGMIGKTFGYLGDIIDTLLPKQSFMAEQWEKHIGKLNKLNLTVGEVRDELQGIAKDPWADEIAVDLDMLIEKAKAFAVVLLDPWSNTLHKRSGTADVIDQLLGDAIVGMDKLQELAKKNADAAKRAGEETKRWLEQFEKIKEKRFMPRAMTDPVHNLPRDFAAQPDPTDRRSALEQAVGVAGGRGFLNNESEADMWNNLAGQIAAANLELSAFERAHQNLAESMRLGVVAQVERLGDTLADAFMTGELSFSKMVDAMIRDMTRLAIKGLVVFGAQSVFPSLFQPGFGSLAGSAGLDMVPRFASGGAGRVDTDSMFVGLRMSPNERLIVQTPGQQMATKESARAPAAAPAQPLVVYIDERAIAAVMRSPMGATVIDDVLRKNPGLLKR